MEEQDVRQSIRFSVWKAMFACASDFYPRFGVVIALMACVAGIDALIPFIAGWAIDNVVIPQRTAMIPLLGVIWITVTVAQGIFIQRFIHVSGTIDMGINYEVRKRAFGKLQELSLSYFDRTSSGWLMARMTGDIGRLSDIMAWGIVDLAWGFCMMAIMAMAMLIMNPGLALVTLSVLPVLVLASVWFQRRILDNYREVRKLNSKLTSDFAEGIRGMQTVKTLVRERERNAEFGTIARAMRTASVKASAYSAVFLPLVVAAGYVGTAFALLKGTEALGTGLSYGTLVAFIFCSVQFFDPVTELARVFAELQYAQASAERVISLLDTKAEISDTEAVRTASGDFDPSGRTPPSGHVKFEDVTFAYRDGKDVLRNFSLDVKAGTTVALVGETGSGKSTVVNLALRFYEPTGGRILIDGTDYKERSVGWIRSSLGYVLQSPYLFTGTVAENILYGKPGATSEELLDAARTVRADEFISKLDKGYDTQVGEGGALLSQGQKQLISFARAVLADPSIFVLDEATSSVDTETEKIIQDAITVTLKGRTSFVIAHRLSTIVHADIIVVLKDGEILEKGTHRDLMARHGYYRKLFTNQFMEEKEEELLNA